jgi:hypothetical protein
MHLGNKGFWPGSTWDIQLAGVMGLATAGLMVVTFWLISCWAYGCYCFELLVSLIQ